MSKTLGIERFRSSGHSTHSYGGTFGAAAAAGALARINATQARYLLSYAAQQASGLSCWARDVEHIEKAFDFGGMPARNGVTAATMVASGFTGVDDVFAGDRGFFHAHERYAQPDLLVHGLGKEFDIMQTAIKRWPVGYPIQAPLDALSNLMRAHTVGVDDIGQEPGDLVPAVEEPEERRIGVARDHEQHDERGEHEATRHAGDCWRSPGSDPGPLGSRGSSFSSSRTLRAGEPYTQRRTRIETCAP